MRRYTAHKHDQVRNRSMQSKLSRHSLQWRQNRHDGVSNHQPHQCLLNRLFSADQRKHQISAPLFEGNSPVTGEFPTQMASNAENVSILMTSSCTNVTRFRCPSSNIVSRWRITLIVWLLPLLWKNSACFKTRWGRLNNIFSGIILGMASVNERSPYIVTSLLIGWPHTQNAPCLLVFLSIDGCSRNHRTPDHYLYNVDSSLNVLM